MPNPWQCILISSSSSIPNDLSSADTTTTYSVVIIQLYTIISQLIHILVCDKKKEAKIETEREESWWPKVFYGTVAEHSASGFSIRFNDLGSQPPHSLYH